MTSLSYIVIIMLVLLLSLLALLLCLLVRTVNSPITLDYSLASVFEEPNELDIELFQSRVTSNAWTLFWNHMYPPLEDIMNIHDVCTGIVPPAMSHLNTSQSSCHIHYHTNPKLPLSVKGCEICGTCACLLHTSSVTLLSLSVCFFTNYRPILL